MFASGISSNVFDNGEFWYYSNLIRSNDRKSDIPLTPENYQTHFDKHDVIIVLSSIPNLVNPGWGFVDHTYNRYFKAK